jgi:hypothetical protein
MTIFNIVLATVLVSSLSMVGVLFLSLQEATLKKPSAALFGVCSLCPAQQNLTLHEAEVQIRNSC